MLFFSCIHRHEIRGDMTPNLKTKKNVLTKAQS